MPTTALRFLVDEEASTAIEYALVAALIALVVIIGIGAMGQAIGLLYGPGEGSVSNSVSGAGS